MSEHPLPQTLAVIGALLGVVTGLIAVGETIASAAAAETAKAILTWAGYLAIPILFIPVGLIGGYRNLARMTPELVEAGRELRALEPRLRTIMRLSAGWAFVLMWYGIPALLCVAIGIVWLVGFSPDPHWTSEERQWLRVFGGLYIAAGLSSTWRWGRELLRKREAERQPCPICHETISSSALVCRYCGSPLADPEVGRWL